MESFGVDEFREDRQPCCESRPGECFGWVVWRGESEEVGYEGAVVAFCERRGRGQDVEELELVVVGIESLFYTQSLANDGRIGRLMICIMYFRRR